VGGQLREQRLGVFGEAPHTGRKFSSAASFGQRLLPRLGQRRRIGHTCLQSAYLFSLRPGRALRRTRAVYAPTP